LALAPALSWPDLLGSRPVGALLFGYGDRASRRVTGQRAQGPGQLASVAQRARYCVPVIRATAMKRSGTTRPVTTPPLEEAASGMLEGMAHEALAGQCAKGPNQLRVPRGDRPREPRRRKTAGLAGAVGTPPGGRVTATRKIAQHHRLALTRARIVGANPIWSRTKPWKLLRLWRRRGAWASHRQQTRPGPPDGARADGVPSEW
jgi:hypothetical protein